MHFSALYLLEIGSESHLKSSLLFRISFSAYLRAFSCPLYKHTCQLSLSTSVLQPMIALFCSSCDFQCLDSVSKSILKLILLFFCISMQILSTEIAYFLSRLLSCTLCTSFPTFSIEIWSETHLRSFLLFIFLLPYLLSPSKFVLKPIRAFS